MKKDQFKPLTQEQISVIETLLEKWTSQRQISRITKHWRGTIRNYRDKMVSRRIKEAIDRYTSHIESNIRVYTMSTWIFYFILIGIVALSMFGLYFLINI